MLSHCLQDILNQTTALLDVSFDQEAEDEETVASEKSVKTEEKTITTAPSETKPETSHSTLEPYDPNVPVGKMTFDITKLLI